MSTSSFNPDSTPAEFDLALSRLVDGVASRTDIEFIDAEEAARPGAWREVALAQKLNTALTADLRPILNAAASITLPDSTLARPSIVHPATHDAVAERFSRRFRTGTAWAGWAAAAVIAMSFQMNQPSGVTSPIASPIASTAGAPILSAAESLADYLSKGRNDGTVIGELPKKLLVNTAQTSDGQAYEVIFIRQIMERVRVDDLYRFSSDELGNPTPVKVQPLQNQQPLPSKPVL